MLRRKSKMTVNEAVDKGAEIFADMEAKAKEIKQRSRELREVFETIRDAGLIGNLETTAITMEAEALTKKFEADLYVFHSQLTQRCKALGIDVPTIMGGGDR
jgi:rRNA maturation endonuclease Nob1